MKNDLLKVTIRKNALFIPQNGNLNGVSKKINETTSVLLANCAKLGYTFSEPLLAAINPLTTVEKLEVFNLLKDVSGVNKNWTPLVKQWNIPTGESIIDHVITWFSNIFQVKNGTTLPCGHIIPNHTFPIDRYNGCPFCGTPFEFDKLDYTEGANKLKVLDLWTEVMLKDEMNSFLTSPVALDATQVDSLKVLLQHFAIDANLEIRMKETMMVVIDAFVESGKPELAGRFFKTPNDILRYLWYKHTGFLQLIEPKTIVNRMTQNARYSRGFGNEAGLAKLQAIADLKLKFNRSECKQYAIWLNNLKLSITDQCEQMHPKRNMWVRVIRALRLAEYSKRKGFENLAALLDTFYNKKYEVWQGKVNHLKLKSDAEGTLALLKQRPGLFARSLFSTMVWFGPDITIQNFKEVMDKVPARLIYTLNMYAESYFDKNALRSVKPLGGVNKKIPANKLIQFYSDEELQSMKLLVQSLSLEVIKRNLQKVKNTNSTIFIDEGLFKIPIAIGDRNEQLQDLPEALMGTRFKVEGNTIRLFLQWGEGLPAQHLDMDLSCNVAYENRNEFCSYSQLVIPGCKHSGDIQSIPDKVGTAEYIDLDLVKLNDLGAKFISFTCNAFTSGNISPNLVVGWMNSRVPMKISSSGVAYDPTAVQHQVRIKQNLTKGMVFGVLDIEKCEVIWLEMSFSGQIVQGLDRNALNALINKLDAKLKIGDLLQLKADVQGLNRIDDATIADEVYDMKWALNTAEVSKLFLE
ncbi:hypothetical protein [Crocinitomix catalasitica]|uniref:hypothetical protein n=1 Tax=Crocinitomix catalasitica TaxID=184607 RepID=UPI00047F61DE|nr:hypothetical protein [Crocinitomix catalasitica]